ncbi:hypothetical protein CASFOL_020903 [Castilleja foliolosa]|uniref:Uncharacterized protein n=1 Tax=Castilleja foliolosa TaxID=1961234 RepID=A0ABD3D5V2_9LAMI
MSGEQFQELIATSQRGNVPHNQRFTDLDSSQTVYTRTAGENNLWPDGVMDGLSKTSENDGLPLYY